MVYGQLSDPAPSLPLSQPIPAGDRQAGASGAGGCPVRVAGAVLRSGKHDAAGRSDRISVYLCDYGVSAAGRIPEISASACQDMSDAAGGGSLLFCAVCRRFRRQMAGLCGGSGIGKRYTSVCDQPLQRAGRSHGNLRVFLFSLSACAPKPGDQSCGGGYRIRVSAPRDGAGRVLVSGISVVSHGRPPGAGTFRMDRAFYRGFLWSGFCGKVSV